MNSATQSNSIDYFDCIMICTLLSHALDGDSMKKLCRKFKCGGEKAGKDPNFAFYTIHHQCHKKDSKLKHHLEASFNRRFAEIMKIIRALPDYQKDGLCPTIRQLYKADSAATLWALLTDKREAFQNRGVYLVHTAALKTPSKDLCKQSSPRVPCDNTKTQQNQEITRLKRQLLERDREIDRLTITAKQRKQDIDELKEVPDITAKLKRKIRKLEHELSKDRQQSIIQEISNKASRLAETRTIKPEPITNDSCPTSCNLDCHECELHQQKVAVVGGIDRMMPKYKSVIDTMGGELLYHNGKCNGRRALTLRSTICDADVVVFITTINSHNALDISKSECKKTGKQFIVMRETSPDRLRQVLTQNITTEEVVPS